MNTPLWTSILAFNFDEPLSEYGFTTRLAKENYWTRNFTDKAILEYKKFMYLAATSDLMVSPSEIVDVVWHQHLIFTQSYSDFCNVLGKTIQHVPSTHNKADFAKFHQAKERTTKLYHQEFGEQPKEVWEYSDMYASLELPKADLKLRAVIIVGVLLWIILLAPFYLLLRTLYATIDNPDFMNGFMVIAGVAFITLWFINSNRLKKIVYSFPDFSFVYNLHPYEMIYLKTGKMEDVIHNSLNSFIQTNKVFIDKNKNTLKLTTEELPKTAEEFAIIEMFRQLGGTTYYPILLRNITSKPIYSNVENSMEAFKKYIAKSEAFGKLFYLNLGVLLFILELGTVRLLTGMVRDKPLVFISIALLVFIVVTVIFLRRLTNDVAITILPSFYRSTVLPLKQKLRSQEWSYFIVGQTILASAFVPLVDHVERQRSLSSSDSGSSSSSCGSSCGSSCSSCGGCGGD